MTHLHQGADVVPFAPSAASHLCCCAQHPRAFLVPRHRACPSSSVSSCLSSSPPFCWVSLMVLLTRCTLPFARRASRSSDRAHFGARLSHQVSALVCWVQCATGPVQAGAGWCVPCVPEVQICCKNISWLVVFLLCPSYPNGHLLE